MKIQLVSQYGKRCVFLINGQRFVVDSNLTAHLSVVSVVRDIKAKTGLSLMESLLVLQRADYQRVEDAAKNWHGWWAWRITDGWDQR